MLANSVGAETSFCFSLTSRDGEESLVGPIAGVGRVVLVGLAWPTQLEMSISIGISVFSRDV